jgi:two-component system, OmpR family, sensor histidine kinase BaeS
MPDPHEHGHGPWRAGPPLWMRDGRFDAGRRFRRGVFGVFLLVVLLVAALASVVGSLASGTHPKPFITITVAALVVVGLLVTARWLWRSGRSIGALMDAADRVAGGDYTTRVGAVPGRPYQRLAGAFDEMTGRLQTNEERRRELLADVAHELRTPLQAIRGATEGMLDGLYPADEAHLRPVLERTEVMARLLDDLRTVSMAEAGVLELHRETVDPRAAATDAIAAVRATSDGVAFDVQDDGGRGTIEADPVRLAEILTNVLANAARYTPSGGRVTVAIEADGPGGARFIVDDTGPGIAADQLPHVFDRFVRSADRGGTGLGLAIAKRLVEAHGGTIGAGAAPGGGTRVRFDIPGDLARR